MGYPANESTKELLAGDLISTVEKNGEAENIEEIPKSPIYDECLETSCLSETRWERSLKKGCLNKGLNEKSKLYSRVRQLTTHTNLPLGSILISKGKNHPGISSKNPPDPAQASCDSLPINAVAIVEDASKPPQEKGEVIPLSFTDDEFISYLHSPEWGGSKLVRLISGDLLQRILTALYTMESRRMIFTRNAKAYLNNGWWKSSSMEIAKKMSEMNRSTSKIEIEETKDWINEKLLLNMTYYGKLKYPPDIVAKSSNEALKAVTPFGIKPDIAKLDVKIPFAYKLISVDKVKLPPVESENPIYRIKRLQQEIVDLVEKQEKEMEEKRHNTVITKGKDKGKGTEEQLDKTTKGNKEHDETSGVIEDIAEDPYLVLTGTKKSTSKESIAPIIEEQNVETVPDEVQAMEGEDKDEKELDVHDSKDTLLNNPDEGETKDHVEITDEHEEDNKNIDQVTTQIFSDVDLKQVNESEKEKSVEDSVSSETSSKNTICMKKRLHLSGNELYVSGLYTERKTNAVPIAVRLHKANQQRLKNRQETAERVYDEFCKSRGVDLVPRFKRLVIAKEQERIKATSPNIVTDKKKKTQIPGKQNLLEDSWMAYHRDQEKMEMRSAIDNDLENRVLKRIKEINTPKPFIDVREEVQDSKKGKQKNKNNSCFHGDVTNNAQKPKIEDEANSNPISFLKCNREKCLARTEVNQNSYNPTRTSRNSKDMLKSQRKCFGITYPERNGGLDTLQLIKSSKLKSVRFSSPLTLKRESLEVGKVSDMENDAGLKECCNSREYQKAPLTIQLVKRNTMTPSTHLPIVSRYEKINNLTFQNNTHKANSRMNRIYMSSDQSDTGIGNRRIPRDWNRNSFTSSSGHLESKLDDNNIEKSMSRISKTYNEALENEESQETPEPPESSPRQSESEILRQDLLQFDASCDCGECACDDQICLEALRPVCRDHPFTYPVKLGCLKRSFRYLETLQDTRASSYDTKAHESTKQLSNECLITEILKLLDIVTIRKEILTSSHGKTFTTIVFIK